MRVAIVVSALVLAFVLAAWHVPATAPGVTSSEAAYAKPTPLPTMTAVPLVPDYSGWRRVLGYRGAFTWYDTGPVQVQKGRGQVLLDVNDPTYAPGGLIITFTGYVKWEMASDRTQDTESNEFCNWRGTLRGNPHGALGEENGFVVLNIHVDRGYYDLNIDPIRTSPGGCAGGQLEGGSGGYGAIGQPFEAISGSYYSNNHINHHTWFLAPVH